jgi:hypothetical protein
VRLDVRFNLTLTIAQIECEDENIVRQYDGSLVALSWMEERARTKMKPPQRPFEFRAITMGMELVMANLMDWQSVSTK